MEKCTLRGRGTQWRRAETATTTTTTNNNTFGAACKTFAKPCEEWDDFIYLVHNDGISTNGENATISKGFIFISNDSKHTYKIYRLLMTLQSATGGENTTCCFERAVPFSFV